MKIIPLLLFLFLFQTTAFCQSPDSITTITPSIAKKIDQQVKAKVDSFKATLHPDDESQDYVQFEIDTFRIERYQDLSMDYDWSNQGLVTAIGDAATKYDSLLNKYYKKLLAVLQPKGRRVLVEAERAWITFRDRELDVMETINEEIFGGGSIQQVNYASEYYQLTKDRAIAIFNNYDLATQH